MKRLLIIFFICLLGGGQTTQAQTIGDDLNELYDKIGLTPDDYLLVYYKLLANFDRDVTGISGMQYSSHTRCFEIMIQYAYEYERHEKRINSAANCQEKYDLYGVLLMLIASSTAISYCPEDMLEILNNPNRAQDKAKFLEEVTYLYELNASTELRDRMRAQDRFSFIESWYHGLIVTIGNFLKQYKLHGLGNYIQQAVIDLINEYFHPNTIINNSLEIGEKMDLLPCSPGSQHRRN